jgi:DNA-binding NarL/FixJ family response regulator
MVRYMLRLAMRGRPGIEIIGEAATGPETLDACRRLQPDVLVLDLVLPGLHGFEVVRRLRREKPWIKILVLTGSDERDAELEAVRLGIDGYVEKNSSADDIVDAIEAVAAGTAVAPRRALGLAASSIGSATMKDQSRADGRNLTPREREVLRLIAGGITSRQMASRLNVSLSTIESHIANVYWKLDIRNRVEAAHQAVALGIVHGR